MRVFAAFLALFLSSTLPAIEWSDLVGAPFTLLSLTVKEKKIKLPPNRRPTMQFSEKNRLGGLAGVNHYSAEAAVSGKEAFTIGPPISTKMAGPPDAMAVEDNFLQALPMLTRIELKGGKLKLTSADGKTFLELTR